MSKKAQDFRIDIIDITIGRLITKRIKKSKLQSFFKLNTTLRGFKLRIKGINSDGWKKGIIKTEVSNYFFGKTKTVLDININRMCNAVIRDNLDPALMEKLKDIFFDYIDSKHTKESLAIITINTIRSKLLSCINPICLNTFNIRTSCEFHYLTNPPISNNQFFNEIATKPILLENEQ